jgi:hypothetical protein
MAAEFPRPITLPGIPSALAREQAAPSEAITNAATRMPTNPGADGLLDTVVLEINEAFRAGTMDIHIAIGRLIITRLYGGDLRVWRAHGAKETSFAKLAVRSGNDLLVSATSLYRAVALFELTERLGISAWKYLGVSHLRAVLSLPDFEQRRLLATAEKDRWTVKRIEGEASTLRQTQERRRGRHPLPPFVKTIHRVAKALFHPSKALAGLHQIDKLTDAEISSLHKLVLQTKEQFDALDRRLAGRLRGRSQKT